MFASHSIYSVQLLKPQEIHQ